MPGGAIHMMHTLTSNDATTLTPKVGQHPVEEDTYGLPASKLSGVS